MESSDEDEDMLAFDADILSHSNGDENAGNPLNKSGDRVNTTDFETQELDRSEEVTPPIRRKGRPTLLLTRSTPVLKDTSMVNTPSKAESKSPGSIIASPVLAENNRTTVSDSETDIENDSDHQTSPEPQTRPRRSAIQAGLISDDDNDESVLVAGTQVTHQQRNDNSVNQSVVSDSDNSLLELDTEAMPRGNSSHNNVSELENARESDDEMETQGLPDFDIEESDEEPAASVPTEPETNDHADSSREPADAVEDSDEDSLLEIETQGFREADDEELLAADTQAMEVADTQDISGLLDMETQASVLNNSDELNNSDSLLVAETQPGRERQDCSISQLTHNVSESLLLEMETQAVTSEDGPVKSAGDNDDDRSDSEILALDTQATEFNGDESPPSQVPEALLNMETQAIEMPQNDLTDSDDDELFTVQTQAVRFRAESPVHEDSNNRDDDILSAETQAVRFRSVSSSESECEDLLTAETQAVPAHRESDDDDADILAAETQASAHENASDDDNRASPSNLQTLDILNMETQAIEVESDNESLHTDSEEMLLGMQTQAVSLPHQDSLTGKDSDADNDHLLAMETQAVSFTIPDDKSESDQDDDSTDSLLNMQTQAVKFTEPEADDDSDQKDESADALLNAQTQAVVMDHVDSDHNSSVESILAMQTQAVPNDEENDADVDSGDDDDLLLTMQTQAVHIDRHAEDSDHQPSDHQSDDEADIDVPDSPPDVFNMSPNPPSRSSYSPVEPPCEGDEDERPEATPAVTRRGRPSFLSRSSQLVTNSKQASQSSSVETIVDDSLGESDDEGKELLPGSPVIGLLDTEVVTVPLRPVSTRGDNLTTDNISPVSGSERDHGSEEPTYNEITNIELGTVSNYAAEDNNPGENSNHEQTSADNKQSDSDHGQRSASSSENVVRDESRSSTEHKVTGACVSSSPLKVSSPVISSVGGSPGKRQSAGSHIADSIRESTVTTLLDSGPQNAVSRPSRARRKPQKLLDIETPSTSKATKKTYVASGEADKVESSPPDKERNWSVAADKGENEMTEDAPVAKAGTISSVTEQHVSGDKETVQEVDQVGESVIAMPGINTDNGRKVPAEKAKRSTRTKREVTPKQSSIDNSCNDDQVGDSVKEIPDINTGTSKRSAENITAEKAKRSMRTLREVTPKQSSIDNSCNDDESVVVPATSISSHRIERIPECSAGSKKHSSTEEPALSEATVLQDSLPTALPPKTSARQSARNKTTSASDSNNGPAAEHNKIVVDKKNSKARSKLKSIGDTHKPGLPAEMREMEVDSGEAEAKTLPEPKILIKSTMSSNSVGEVTIASGRTDTPQDKATKARVTRKKVPKKIVDEVAQTSDMKAQTIHNEDATSMYVTSVCKENDREGVATCETGDNTGDMPAPESVCRTGRNATKSVITDKNELNIKPEPRSSRRRKGNDSTAAEGKKAAKLHVTTDPEVSESVNKPSTSVDVNNGQSDLSLGRKTRGKRVQDGKQNADPASSIEPPGVRKTTTRAGKAASETTSNDNVTSLVRRSGRGVATESDNESVKSENSVQSSSKSVTGRASRRKAKVEPTEPPKVPPAITKSKGNPESSDKSVTGSISRMKAEVEPTEPPKLLSASARSKRNRTSSDKVENDTASTPKEEATTEIIKPPPSKASKRKVDKSSKKEESILPPLTRKSKRKVSTSTVGDSDDESVSSGGSLRRSSKTKPAVKEAQQNDQQAHARSSRRKATDQQSEDQATKQAKLGDGVEAVSDVKTVSNKKQGNQRQTKIEEYTTQNSTSSRSRRLKPAEDNSVPDTKVDGEKKLSTAHSQSKGKTAGRKPSKAGNAQQIDSKPIPTTQTASDAQQTIANNDTTSKPQTDSAVVKRTSTKGRSTKASSKPTPVMEDVTTVRPPAKRRQTPASGTAVETISAPTRRGGKVKKTTPNTAAVQSDTESLAESVSSSVTEGRSKRGGVRGSASQRSVDTSSPARLSRRCGSSIGTPDTKLSLNLRTSLDTPSFIKVMFTGIADTAPLEKILNQVCLLMATLVEHKHPILSSLGCGIASDFHKATHLISIEAKRTIKFMCAVNRGMHIVTPQWLTQSQKQVRLLPTDKFLLRDKKSEKEYKYNLSLSLSASRENENGLLHGYSVYVSKSTKPPPSEIKDIVTSAGGRFVSGLPKANSEVSPTTVVISCPEDTKLYTPLVNSGHCVVSKEFLLTGVLRQQLQPQQFLLK